MNWFNTKPVTSNSQEASENEFESLYEDVFTRNHDFWMPLVDEAESEYKSLLAK